MNRAAVIYRTNRDGTALAEELTRRGVVFHMKERLISPYRSQAAGDLLAYLSFVFDGHRRGDFLRIMNRPQRFLSREAFQEPEVCFSRLKEYYGNCSYMLPVLERLERDLQRLEGMDLYAAVNYIRKGMGYDEYLYEQEMNRSEKGEKNPLREADWFMQQVRGYEELGEFRIHIRRFEKELEEACAGNRQGEGVSLLTMHASKGLEFDRVYLPDCNEGFTPHRKNMGENGMEEERRMFYVAMTRARDRLTLSWVAGTQKEPGIKSRFLEELGM